MGVGSIFTVVITAIAAGLTLTTSSDSWQMRIALAFCGVWWLGIGTLSLSLLGSRPGPPRPPEQSPVGGWGRLWKVWFSPLGDTC